MKDYKKNFIRFMVDSGVLLFGEFKLKSGRVAPYFVNTGKYETGLQMKKLGEFYAHHIYETIGLDFDVLFGPAYKGIPLVVTTAIALENLYNHSCSICFNRKESKGHGEKGVLVGRKLQDNDRVVILEDVTTAGTSIRETVPLISNAAEINLIGLVVSVDRMEKGTQDCTALEELAKTFEMKTTSIISIREIVSYLAKTPIEGELLINESIENQISQYLEKYGGSQSF